MKKVYMLCAAFCALSALSAQSVSINNTGALANASSMLDITSTSKGLLIPRMTSVQRAAILTPATGLVVFDVTLNEFYYFDGTIWRPMAASGGWLVAGNAVSATHVLGTTNNVSLKLITNNVEKMRLMPTGEVVLNQAGGFGYYTGDIFSAYTAAAGSAINGYASGTADNFGGYFTNSSTGVNAIGVYSSAANGYGVYGTSASSTRFGIYGYNSNATGTGLIASGTGTGGNYLTAGTGGAFTSTNVGVLGVGKATGATGALFAGNNLASPWNTLAGGSGIASNGTAIGVYGRAINSGDNNWGGYFTNGNANGWAYVGGRVGGTDYKINGPGAVSTIVQDLQGRSVNLYCPEAPEVLFQDFGNAQLRNGRATIVLDPVLTKNITVDDRHPLRVMVQLEGDCKGVYVTNKTGNGFEVVELNGGTSNVPFTWFISASRADTYDQNGNLLSRFADVRFGASPTKAQETTQQIGITPVTQAPH